VQAKTLPEEESETCRHLCRPPPSNEVFAELRYTVPQVPIQAGSSRQDIVETLASVGAPKRRKSAQHDVHDNTSTPEVGLS